MQWVWCIRVMPLWAGSAHLHRCQGAPLARRPCLHLVEPQTSCDLAATPWHAFFWAAARFCHSPAPLVSVIGRRHRPAARRPRCLPPVFTVTHPQADSRLQIPLPVTRQHWLAAGSWWDLDWRPPRGVRGGAGAPSAASSAGAFSRYSDVCKASDLALSATGARLAAWGTRGQPPR